MKPGPFNFNYWKRTGKADRDISFFYCVVGGLGCGLLAAIPVGRHRKQISAATCRMVDGTQRTARDT